MCREQIWWWTSGKQVTAIFTLPPYGRWANPIFGLSFPWKWVSTKSEIGETHRRPSGLQQPWLLQQREDLRFSHDRSFERYKRSSFEGWNIDCLKDKRLSFGETEVSPLWRRGEGRLPSLPPSASCCSSHPESSQLLVSDLLLFVEINLNQILNFTQCKLLLFSSWIISTTCHMVAEIGFCKILQFHLPDADCPIFTLSSSLDVTINFA